MFHIRRREEGNGRAGGFGFENDEVKGFSVDDDDGSGGKPKSDEDQQWEDDEADEDTVESVDEQTK